MTQDLGETFSMKLLGCFEIESCYLATLTGYQGVGQVQVLLTDWQEHAWRE